MLCNTLRAVRSARGVDKVRLIVSRMTSELCTLARQQGARCVLERRATLNGALQVEFDEALDQGQAALIVFADLPLLDASVLTRFVENVADAELGLAPDDHGRGTNALLYRGSAPLPMLYGPDSFLRYERLAQARSLTTRVFQHESLARDLDTPQDWARLRPVLSALGRVEELGAAR